MSAEGEEGSKPDLPEKSSSELIKEMFKKADLNNDQRLSKDELKAQILANTNHHLEESKKESDDVFQTVDENGDGRITWDEYKSHFLVEKKLVEKEKIKEHAKNTDDLDTNSRILLDEEKNAFGQSDADNDGLNELEWLGFRHPEHSSVMLKEMAQEILKAFDRDQDGKLSLGEFSRVEGGEVTDPKMEEAYVKERQHEFAQIDVNQDGYATSEELLNYVNPRNERHANAEVSEIMDIADTNEDNFLTLKELLDKAELLATSGFIRPKERLHDDL
jgi:Ca2+-binding EF-hand superfamily protein